ncbi:hypothetical protein D3C79_838740 [compost metagenome]
MQLQPGVELPLGMNVPVRPYHSGHGAIRIARYDAATILYPDEVPVAAATAVLGPVVWRLAAQIGIEAGHHPRQIVRVDQVFPGEYRVVEGVRLIAQHLIPARIAIDEAGVGIPVPDPVADDLQNAVYRGLIEILDPDSVIVLQHGNHPCSAPPRHCG